MEIMLKQKVYHRDSDAIPGPPYQRIVLADTVVSAEIDSIKELLSLIRKEVEKVHGVKPVNIEYRPSGNKLGSPVEIWEDWGNIIIKFPPDTRWYQEEIIKVFPPIKKIGGR
jgi:hypothetical protein